MNTDETQMQIYISLIYENLCSSVAKTPGLLTF